MATSSDARSLSSACKDVFSNSLYIDICASLACTAFIVPRSPCTLDSLFPSLAHSRAARHPRNRVLRRMVRRPRDDRRRLAPCAQAYN